MQVFDKDHLCYWERTRSGHLANLRSDPRVAVMYFSRERGKYLRMYGSAELYEDGPMREQIMTRTPAPELEKDPERRGIGVLIRVDCSSNLSAAYSGSAMAIPLENQG